MLGVLTIHVSWQLRNLPLFVSKTPFSSNLPKSLCLSHDVYNMLYAIFDLDTFPVENGLIFASACCLIDITFFSLLLPFNTVVTILKLKAESQGI